MTDIQPNCGAKVLTVSIPPPPPPPPAESITSRVGTLKRKQMIRDVLQQLDEGYEDDIFDSTPFKKMKKVQVWLCTCAVEGQVEDIACKIRDVCY